MVNSCLGGGIRCLNAVVYISFKTQCLKQCLSPMHSGNTIKIFTKILDYCKTLWNKLETNQKHVWKRCTYRDWWVCSDSSDVVHVLPLACDKIWSSSSSPSSSSSSYSATSAAAVLTLELDRDKFLRPNLTLFTSWVS